MEAGHDASIFIVFVYICAEYSTTNKQTNKPASGRKTPKKKKRKRKGMGRDGKGRGMGRRRKT